MRILLLNWRDHLNPRAGGAELLTYEIARRLVERGHSVTWFTSRPSAQPARETVDGIAIVRRGTEATTRLHARRALKQGDYDLVTEEVNTLPYFAPLWARRPVLFFINQLAREVWWYEAPKPVAVLGWLSEPVYLQAYRRTPTVTISESTREDLRRLGLRGPIDVMPMAVNTDPVAELAPKSRLGRLLAIGRLAPSKRYGHAIEALADLRRTHPQASLTILGEGRERPRLEALATRLGLLEDVHLPGRVSEEEKTQLLTEADALVGTSAREGWGLTVTEAAVRGTPSVVYDIPGFRDSVAHDRTGLLTPPTPTALASSVRRLLDNVELFDRLRGEAWRTAQELSWERTADVFEAAARRAVGSSA